MSSGVLSVLVRGTALSSHKGSPQFTRRWSGAASVESVRASWEQARGGVSCSASSERNIGMFGNIRNIGMFENIQNIRMFENIQNIGNM